MGYGNSGSSLPTTFFKVHTLKPKEKDLYFKGSEKGENGYFDIEDKPTSLFGTVKGVETNKYTYEGKVHNTIKIILDDDDSRVILEMAYSNMLIGLLNTLLGSEEINDLKLSLYVSKKGYKSMWIEIDDVDPKTNKWKFDYTKDLATKITKTPLPDGTNHIDKTKLEEFLMAEVNSEEFQSKIKNKFEKKEELPNTVKKDEFVDSDGNNSQASTQEDDDDLPF